MFCLCFVIHYFVYFLFCNYLDGEERSGCLTMIIFPISCDCYCSVAPPHGALGWSACVIVVFPDHTHFLVLITYGRSARAFAARIYNVESPDKGFVQILDR